MGRSERHAGDGAHPHHHASRGARRISRDGYSVDARCRRIARHGTAGLGHQSARHGRLASASARRQSVIGPRAIARSNARGIAFVLVLWVIAMLSILLGSFALVARTENLQSRHLFDTTQARYAAEAGLNLAIDALGKSD